MPSLPGLTPPDMGAASRPEGFTPTGGDVPIVLEARKPLGPEVRLVNGRAPINARDYAGQTFPADRLPPELQGTYPDGVAFTPQGFPDFGPYAVMETKVEGLTGDRERDERMTNATVGLHETPEGFTWHHVEDGLTMQLVPRNLHGKVYHSGGAAVIKGVKNGS